jgi:hypothetical protein
MSVLQYGHFGASRAVHHIPRHFWWNVCSHFVLYLSDSITPKHRLHTSSGDLGLAFLLPVLLAFALLLLLDLELLLLLAFALLLLLAFALPIGLVLGLAFGLSFSAKVNKSKSMLQLGGHLFFFGLISSQSPVFLFLRVPLGHFSRFDIFIQYVYNLFCIYWDGLVLSTNMSCFTHI